MGERGASMADTTAGGGNTPQNGNTDAARTDGTPAPGKLSRAAPSIAVVTAFRISRHVGSVPLGVSPLTLFATGLALVSQRSSAARGSLCLPGGRLLTWRAQVRAR